MWSLSLCLFAGCYATTTNWRSPDSNASTECDKVGVSQTPFFDWLQIEYEIAPSTIHILVLELVSPVDRANRGSGFIERVIYPPWG